MFKRGTYENPEIEVIKLSTVDIVSTSEPEDEWNDDNTDPGGWVCY